MGEILEQKIFIALIAIVIEKRLKYASAKLIIIHFLLMRESGSQKVIQKVIGTQRNTDKSKQAKSNSPSKRKKQEKQKKQEPVFKRPTLAESVASSPLIQKEKKKNVQSQLGKKIQEDKKRSQREHNKRNDLKMTYNTVQESKNSKNKVMGQKKENKIDDKKEQHFNEMKKIRSQLKEKKDYEQFERKKQEEERLRKQQEQFERIQRELEEKLKKQREKQIEESKELLQDKISIIWIFVIQQELSEEEERKIDSMYDSLSKEKKIRARCRKYWEIKPFLQIKKAEFKIVSDLANISEVLNYQKKKKILEYYIINNEGDFGFAKAVKYARQTKKVKGIFTSIKKIFERAEKGIQNEVDNYEYSQSKETNDTSTEKKLLFEFDDKFLQQQSNKSQKEQKIEEEEDIGFKPKPKLFPSFLKLSGEDKSEATLYRTNLFGAISIKPEEIFTKIQDENEEKKEEEEKSIDSSEEDLQEELDGEDVGFLDQFLKIAEKKEENRQKIEEYKEIQEKIKSLRQSNSINYTFFNQEMATNILKFYTNQSFYYRQLNSSLRTVKTVEEFRKCLLPFNETYHSIRHFYSKYNGKFEAKTYYRGAKLRKQDFQILKEGLEKDEKGGKRKGVFIEMFGFMSTSKSEKVAKAFVMEQDANERYIFVIEVPEMQIPQKYKEYDHGFVDINQNKLSNSEMEIEEEVLFNALNIYKVTKIQRDTVGRHKIYLQYGVIFSLLKKNREELTTQESDVLLNYEYCMRLKKEVEDQGDVYRITNDLLKAKEYYLKKINHIEEEDQEKSHYYSKLANVYQECGELQAAEFYNNKSLGIQQNNAKEQKKQKCIKVFSLHSKNAQIKLQKEDYLSADLSLSEAIAQLPDDNEFQKAKIIRERGEVKFKKGDIKGAQNDFNLSERILQSLVEIESEKRNQLSRQYWWKRITKCLCCSSPERDELDRNRDQMQKKINQFKEKIVANQENIKQEQMKINNALRDVALYVNDKEKYKKYVGKGRKYLLSMQQKETDDPYEKAKLKMAEATMQGYLHLAKSQKLLTEAIQLVESTDPYDENVGKYANILANTLKQELEKFQNDNVELKNEEIEELDEEDTKFQVQKKKKKKKKEKKKQQFDEKKQKQLANKCKNNYMKAINIFLYNKKSSSSPQIMSLKNKIGELDFNEANFVDCQKIVKEVKQEAKNRSHTEVAKAYLLLSKVSLCRGQILKTFEDLQEGEKMLRTVIVVKEDERYEKMFRESEIYLEIQFTKAKIYGKQNKIENCLSGLNEIENILKKKFEDEGIHKLLPQIYEFKGKAYLMQKRMVLFQDLTEKSIKLKKRQAGKFGCSTGLLYCYFAENFLKLEQSNRAEELLEKSAQILSHLPEGHPNIWPLYFVYGMLKMRRKEYREGLQMLSSALFLVQRKYDASHLAISKVRFQYCLSLIDAGKIQESIQAFETLDGKLREELIASENRRFQKKQKIESQASENYEMKEIEFMEKIYEVSQYEEEQQNKQQNNEESEEHQQEEQQKQQQEQEEKNQIQRDLSEINSQNYQYYERSRQSTKEIKVRPLPSDESRSNLIEPEVRESLKNINFIYEEEDNTEENKKDEKNMETMNSTIKRETEVKEDTDAKEGKEYEYLKEDEDEKVGFQKRLYEKVEERIKLYESAKEELESSKRILLESFKSEVESKKDLYRSSYEGLSKQ